MNEGSSNITSGSKINKQSQSAQYNGKLSFSSHRIKLIIFLASEKNISSKSFEEWKRNDLTESICFSFR